jgi:quercetin dioxygenase-like cupin family protein
MRNELSIIGLLAALTVSCLGASVAEAIDHQPGPNPYQDIHALPIPMEQPSTTVLGQAYTFPSGTPLIKVFRITIAPGMKTAPHQHAIPLLAYVLSGELGVDYGSRGKRTFSAGQSYVEAIEWCHVGYGVGDEAVEILGIYLGQQDPDQIKPEPCDGLI